MLANFVLWMGNLVQIPIIGPLFGLPLALFMVLAGGYGGNIFRMIWDFIVLLFQGQIF